MRSVRAQISDAVIARHRAKPTRQISDTRYPLTFRYSADRRRGSWYIVSHSGGKTRWRKIGDYPGITARRAVESLPPLLARLAVEPGAGVAVAQFEAVGGLLDWYCDRVAGSRHLGRGRRAGVKTAINRHLKPKLGKLPVSDLNHETVDELLVQPTQAEYSLPYTRQIFDVLRLAFKQAYKLKRVDINPIGGFVFGDFIAAPIKPRGARLRRNQLPRLLSSMESAGAPQQFLVLWMLLHGTRIGETRQARWDEVDFGDKVWNIPAENTKTGQPLALPLSPYALAMLKRYRAAQTATFYNGVYLFPNRKGGSIGGSTGCDWVRCVSGGDWTGHDLRKLARTCWADLGVDYMVSERLLNHAMGGLDQAYIHTYVEAQKRAALEKYHNWLRSNCGLDSAVLNF